MKPEMQLVAAIFLENGNLLFYWDILFGSAKITRKYPQTFGVENLDPVTAGEQLLWPFIRSR